MKNRSTFVATLALVALLAGRNDVCAADKSAKEEFQQAERILTQKQVNAESVQQEIGRLEAQKAGAQKELTLASTRLTDINAKLSAAINSGHPEDIDKWKREAAVWEARKKNAET